MNKNDELINLLGVTFSGILKNVKIGISLTNYEGRLLYANPSLAYMFGYEKEEEMLQSVNSIGQDLYYNPEDRKLWLEIMEEKNELDDYRIKCKKKDGTPLWVLLTSRAIRDENGRILYFVSTLQDITEKTKEEKIERINLLRQQALTGLIEMRDEPIEKILNYVIEKCMEITESTAGFLGLINENETIMNAVIWSKEVGNQCKVTQYPQEFIIKTGGLWAEAIRQKRTIIINDYELPNPLKKGLPEGHVPIKRFISIPVLSREKVVLVGGFANKDEPYDESDEKHIRLLLYSVWNFIEIGRIQKSLQERELLYRSLYENANDAIFLLKDDKFIDCNPKTLEIFKGRRDQIIGKAPYELSPPTQPDGRDSKEKAFEKIKNVLSGIPQFFEWVHTTCDGVPFYTEVSLNSLKIGEEIYIQAMVRDITERKKAEKELLYERERYALLVEHIPFGMILYDRNGVYQYVNQAWIKMFGYTRDELPDGRAWFYRAYPDREYRKEVIRTWINDTKDIKIGDVRPRIFNVTCKDGTIKVVSFFTVLVENDLIITMALDITDYKRTEEQLFHAQKMEAIGRLAGGVAHDFNNMLTVILGHANLGMLELNPSHPLYQRFNEIKKAGERASELTKNLLAFARKQTINQKVLDLNITIEDMLKMIMRLIGENIELKWIPGKDLWRIKFDPVQLTQVLMNLVVNAKDAISDTGKITIETNNVFLDEQYCRIHYGFQPGEYVMLAVSDNGIGMTKDVLAHIFEPFYTTKDKEKGTGLGLSTVYGIIKQNNGFINVYSEPQKGTTFKIYLPRCSGEEEHETTPLESISKSKGEKILVVEDEMDVLELCVSMLEEIGYSVISASTPYEAIDKLKLHRDEIDLLITDVIMPEMNGKELYKRLQNIKPDLKCLFMSGYTNNAIVHNGIVDKGVNYIQKPFTLHELSSKVREALET